MVVLDDTFPWAWLPLTMGLGVSLVSSSQPWLRPTEMAFPFSASITTGATLTYCYSSKAVTTRLGTQIPHILIIFVAVVFGLSLMLFLGRGISRSSTRSLALWLFVPILAACILGFVSGGIGGSDHMIRWLVSVTHWSPGRAEAIVHYFRKGIHLSAYGFIALCLFQGAVVGKATRLVAILFGLLVVLCFACFDEMRQTTAPNRTGSAWDVALDMSGACLFMTIGAIFTPDRKQRRPLQNGR